MKATMMIPSTLLSILLVGGSTAAQDLDTEIYARLLVDHPAEASGDLDTVFSSWLDLVAEEPAHPLADAALALLRERVTAAAHPRRIAERLLETDGAGLGPAAARDLLLLKGWAHLWFTPLGELPADVYAGWLSRYWVLGPLGPLGDPAAALATPHLFTDPGFDRVHETLAGPGRWRQATRPGTTRLVIPANAMFPRSGYVMTAVRFDVPAGGPAWLEVDIAGSSGPRESNTFDPSYAWALNGAEPRQVDLFSADQPAISRFPVALLTGRNQLVLRSSLEASVYFGIRVLGLDGRPIPGLVEANDSKPLGEPAGGAPVEARYVDAEAYLEGLAQRGPNAEALLGLLKFHDRRQADGMAHLRAAHEQAPAALGLKALLARTVDDAGYLPSTWRTNRARQLAQEVIDAAPTRLDMGLHIAGVLAGEDREEEAIGLLRRLSDELPQQSDSLLKLAGVYRELDMTAQAEAALFEAEVRAPDCRPVLWALQQHYDKVGQKTRSFEAHRRYVRAAGATSNRLEDLAGDCARPGLVDEAEALYHEAADRSGRPEDVRDLAAFFSRIERYDDADECYERAGELFPLWDEIPLKRADVAHLSGKRRDEARQLREVLDRSPGHLQARHRLEQYTGEDETLDLYSRFRADRDAVLASYVDGTYDDSVVHVLRSAVIKVFPDGSVEALQHDIHQVRDLEGCEQQGKRRLAGDVLKIVTIKQGEEFEYEPVRVNREYVMPSLEPGDFVEAISRLEFGAPRDGVFQINALSLASTAVPVHRCRFVVSVPKSLPARLVTRNFDGTHDTIEEGDQVIHVLELADQKRVLAEPGAPPWQWYLPWFRIGMDRDREASLAILGLETRLPTRTTPEIEAAAAAALEGVSGDEARARRLHQFVNETLDQRWPKWTNSATEALLSREGNPNSLYAALLSAAGIPHDLIWSRDYMPEGDPDPDPVFVDASYWKRKLYVRVSPADGPVAWCDLTERTMPYGLMFGNAPRAPAYSVDHRETLELPDLPLEELPGVHLDMQFRLDTEGGATVEGKVRFPDGLAHAVKRQIQEIPATQRRYVVISLANQLFRGIEVKEYEIAGLEDDAPLGGWVKAAWPSFLDETGDQLTGKLPIKPAELSGQFGGEGQRTLPFFLSSAMVQTTRARLELPAGLELVDPPQELKRSFKGGHYLLSVTPDGESAWLVRHEVILPPFVLEPEEFADFREFCAKVDEAERAQLRFRRT